MLFPKLTAIPSKKYISVGKGANQIFSVKIEIFSKQRVVASQIAQTYEHKQQEMFAV